MSGGLPVTVIGGYLGAGKTTLLNHILAGASGLRAAVLVNDFGSVNIDAELIAAHEGETVSLANGCVCCSMADGLHVAMGEVLKRAERLDHVVIEASGVAEPGKVAQAAQAWRLPLDGVLVVADAEQVRRQAANRYVGETVLRQLAQADLILLNKTDLVAADDLAAVRAWLDQRVPGTPRLETVAAAAPVSLLLGRGVAHALEPVDEAHHEAAYRSWTVEREAPVARAALERLARRLAQRAVRAKGFVRLRETPEVRHLYQQVGARWTLQPAGAWPEGRRATRLVAIGIATPHSTGDATGI